MELKRADLKVGDRIQRKQLKVITLSGGIITNIAKNTEIIWVEYDGFKGMPLPECAWEFERQSPESKSCSESKRDSSRSL